MFGACAHWYHREGRNVERPVRSQRMVYGAFEQQSLRLPVFQFHYHVTNDHVASHRATFPYLQFVVAWRCQKLPPMEGPHSMGSNRRELLPPVRWCESRADISASLPLRAFWVKCGYKEGLKGPCHRLGKQLSRALL